MPAVSIAHATNDASIRGRVRSAQPRRARAVRRRRRKGGAHRASCPRRVTDRTVWSRSRTQWKLRGMLRLRKFLKSR